MTPRPWLSAYAKLVVLAVFALIFAGGLVTSWGAGMAAPDWPFTFGSLNPAGWWDNFPLRLEHGHRLIAIYVGFLTAFLTAAIWRHRWLMIVIGALAAVHALYLIFGTPHAASHSSSANSWQSSLIAAAVILFIGGIFAAVLVVTSPPAPPGERTLRWLSFAALVGVCLQATLGGIRVTSQTAGSLDLALFLRIVHGCVAQAYLCIVVTIATFLARSGTVPSQPGEFRGLRTLAWLTSSIVFAQLIVGATMRHLGAGLAISTFPAATANGAFMPAIHNALVDVNFTHTRVGALLVTVLVSTLAFATVRRAEGRRQLLLPACTLLALLLVQLTLGVLVVLHTKPPTLTTFHVLNGAVLLATAVLLALRLGFLDSVEHVQEPSVSPQLPIQATA